MAEAKYTIRSRELGDGPRQGMAAAKLNGRRAAVKLGWSASRVSRLLTGRLGATEVDVSQFLAVCDVIGPARDRLMRLSREQNTPGWLQEHDSRLPEQLKTLVDHENRAAKITDFEAIRIPHAAVVGSCRLVEFAEFKRVVYVEEETAGHFLEGPAETAAYRNFAALANSALDVGRPKDLIAALAVDLYSDGEDHHDRA